MRLSYQSRIMACACLMLLIMILIVMALLFPRTERIIKVMDILFVLDITQSMDVVDAEIADEKVSRLTWSKDYVRQTLQALPCGSHVGLAVFSQSRSLVLMNPVEVCSAYSDLSQILTKINGSMAWALSSEISKAAFTAIDQAKQMDPSPSVVFITDGHEAPPLHTTLFPKYNKTIGEIKGVFVGVGGDTLLAIPKHDLAGNENGFWQQNEVLHEDVYASLRNESQEVRSAKPRNEHLSSQKKDHIKHLAKMLEFNFVLSPSKPMDVIKNIGKDRRYS